MKGKKTGGRTKGVTNKPKPFKALFENLLSRDFSKFEAELGKLDSKNYVDAYLKMLEYILPKRKHVTNNIDFSKLSEEEAAVVIDDIVLRLQEGDTDNSEALRSLIPPAKTEIIIDLMDDEGNYL